MAKKAMTPEDIEELIGTKLPDDYRAFLSGHAESHFDVSKHYPITEKTPFGDTAVLDELATLKDFEKDGVNGFQDVSMLIIGSNLFGYPTCLCLSPERFGHIFYYDIQQRSLWEEDQFYSMFENLADEIKDYLKMRSDGKLPQKEEGFESFYHAANSFTEFMGLLKDEEIED